MSSKTQFDLARCGAELAFSSSLVSGDGEFVENSAPVKVVLLGSKWPTIAGVSGCPLPHPHGGATTSANSSAATSGCVGFPQCEFVLVDSPENAFQRMVHDIQADVVILDTMPAENTDAFVHELFGGTEGEAEDDAAMVSPLIQLRRRRPRARARVCVSCLFLHSQHHHHHPHPPSDGQPSP